VKVVRQIEKYKTDRIALAKAGKIEGIEEFNADNVIAKLRKASNYSGKKAVLKTVNRVDLIEIAEVLGAIHTSAYKKRAELIDLILDNV